MKRNRKLARNLNSSFPKIIRGNDLRALVDFSDRRLRELSDEGYFSRPVDGEYLCSEVFIGLLKYERQKTKQSEMSLVKLQREKDRGRKDKVDADKAEESVIDKATGQREATRFAAGLMHRVLAVPKRVSQRFALETDPQAIDSFLENELRLAVTEARKFEYGLAKCSKCKTEIQL